jgi:iron complex transport system substrate-binding protein
MWQRFLLAAAILAVFAGSFLARQLLPADEPTAPADGDARRIVSMAPSITETLYAVGLGDRVVGVTEFCRYPPAAQELPKVGGYHNPNFEAVVGLAPDLVILLSGDQPSQSAFHKLHIGTLVVCHDNVEGILDSFLQIGRMGGAEAEARRLVADTGSRLEWIRAKTAGLSRPKVLVVIERGPSSGKLEDVYVVGRDGLFDKMVELAGGQNAYPQTSVRFPVVSAEGILWMNPEVIVDLSAGVAAGTAGQQGILAAWQRLPEVAAVRSGRVHALNQDYAFVHGPRFMLLIEDLARLIHPEVDWQ